MGRASINTSHLVYSIYNKGGSEGKEALKSEPIIDTGERKIKLNQQGESRGESEGDLPIFQHQIKKGSVERRNRHSLLSVLPSQSWEL